MGRSGRRRYRSRIWNRRKEIKPRGKESQVKNLNATRHQTIRRATQATVGADGSERGENRRRGVTGHHPLNVQDKAIHPVDRIRFPTCDFDQRRGEGGGGGEKTGGARRGGDGPRVFIWGGEIKPSASPSAIPLFRLRGGGGADRGAVHADGTV